MKDSPGKKSELIAEISALKKKIQKLEKQKPDLKPAKKPIHESRHQWSDAFDAINDSVCLIAPNGKIIRHNKATELLLGKSASELDGHFCFEVVHGISKPLAVCPLLLMKKTRRRESTIIQLGDRWLEVTTDPIKEDNRLIVAAVHIITDITEHKRAEAALKESELKYRSLVECSSDAIFCVDEKGQYQFTNHLFASTFGKSPDYFIGKTFWDIYPKEHADQRYAVTKRVFETGKSESFEVEVPLPNQTLYFYATANPIKDETGKVIQILTHANNITERKQAVEALRASEENFRRSLDESPLGVRIVTAKTETIYANRAILDFYGYDSIEELKATPVEKRYTRDSYAEFQIRREKRKRGADVSSEYTIDIIRKDGKVRHLKVYRKEILWNGERQYQVIYQDITEEQEALQKFNKLFHGNPAPMAVSNLTDRKLTDVNDAFLKVVNYSREEAIGKTTAELGIFIQPDKQRKVADELQATGRITNVELKLKSKDGAIIDGLFSGEIIESQGKKYFLTVMIDQTERKLVQARMENALAALQESEAQYRLLSEHTTDSVWLMDMNLNVTYRSPSVGVLRGLTQQEIIEMPWDQQITPKSLKLASELLAQEIPKVEANPDYNPVRTVELEYYCKDGSILFTENKFSIIRDENGRPLSILCETRDIRERRRAEEALRESEERFSRLANATWEGIIIHREGIIMDANESAAKMFGYTAEEAIGRNVIDFLAPESIEPALQNLKKGTTNDQLSIEVKGVRKDKTVFSAEVLGRSIRYNNIDARVFAFRDITERKRTEESLRRSEANYRSVIENIQDVFYRSDTQGNLIMASPSFSTLLGYESLDDCLGKPMGNSFYYDPEKRTEFIRQIQEARSVTNYEVVLKRRDGTPVTVETNSHFYLDAAGNINGIEGIFRDITARKHWEDTLQKSEQRYRLLIENANESVMVIQDGMFKFVNNHAIESFGYSEQEFLSTPIVKLIHPEDLDEVMKRYLQKINGDTTPTKHTYRAINKSGYPNWIEISSVLIDWEGRPATLNLITDITARKQAEEEKKILQERLQQADKMEAIGTLAGGIAHDFNNLLMGIQGYASMTLMNIDPSNPNYERLKRIEEQVQSGADLTSQLLGFARGGRYEVKPTDINEIIEKTSSMFGRTKKEIAINRKTAKDLWNVEVDRGQMEQVFLNLYVNAWQAMPGGGDIYLETQNVLLNDEKVLPFSGKPGKHVKITITDTGTGMDEKTKERIFDPFFTTKAMGRGTGLGLATVYGIIKGHHGMINVYSEPGHGTTFTIYLPASDKEIPKEKAPIGEIITGTETILLVDDEKMVLEVNRELLESMGYKVYGAGSGQEGIAIYAENKDKIDLVILDMIMPGISGSETFDRLREINPDIKVLLSSGYSLNGEAQTIMDRGCNGFLQKPFRLEELSGKVREMLM